jgi:hypothetical protein
MIFKVKDRVVVRSTGGWRADFVGTVETLAEPAGTVGHDDHTYFIRFDYPQFDLDGDGPYRGAQILGRHLALLKPDFESYKNLVFFEDGSLRDLRIIPADRQIWCKLFDYLRHGNSEVQTTFLTNNEDYPIPNDTEGIFSKDRCSSIEMTTVVGDIELKTHFFEISTIEFDLDPRHVSTEKQLDLLFAHLRDLARFLERDVQLTEENQEDLVLLTISRNGSIIFGKSGA